MDARPTTKSPTWARAATTVTASRLLTGGTAEVIGVTTAMAMAADTAHIRTDTGKQWRLRTWTPNPA